MQNICLLSDMIAQTELAEQKGRRRNQLSREGEANVCETRADAQEPAARRLAARVGVSSPRGVRRLARTRSSPSSPSSRCSALARRRRCSPSGFERSRRGGARLAWRDAESSRIRAGRTTEHRPLSHSCPTLRRPRLPWRVSSSGGPRRVGLMQKLDARVARRYATWWGSRRRALRDAAK